MFGSEGEGEYVDLPSGRVAPLKMAKTGAGKQRVFSLYIADICVPLEVVKVSLVEIFQYRIFAAC